jgi:hypothetical protein
MTLPDIPFYRSVMGLALPDRDLSKGHILLQRRLPKLLAALEADRMPTQIEEIYRPNARQQWLYGQGRTGAQLAGKGVEPRLAQPAKPIVTNAWSSSTSAHGYTEGGVPASCAADLVPVGADGRKWTADDPWDDYCSLVAAHGAELGLVQFHAPGKAVTDRPHVQLVEWRDGPLWKLLI